MNKKTKRTITGRVVSSKTPKTVVVLIESERMHPLYKKSFKRSKRYLVHDEVGANLGDLVKITQIRPISKNKHFQVQEIIGKNMEAIIVEQLKEKAAEVIAEVMSVELEDQMVGESEKIEKKTKVKKVSKK